MLHSNPTFQTLSSSRPNLDLLLNYARAHWQRYLSVVASILALLLAASASDSSLLPFSVELPYYYFVLLRLLVCTVSAYSAVRAHKANSGFWMWALGANAILFNPVLPVRMERSDWAVVNLLDALFLLIWAGLCVLGDIKKDKELLKQSHWPPSNDPKFAVRIRAGAPAMRVDQSRNASPIGALVSRLIETATEHSKKRAEQFLATHKSGKLRDGLYFETMALELSATIRAAEDSLTGDLWEEFGRDYEERLKPQKGRENFTELLNDRLATYAACYTRDRDGDGISTVGNAFAYVCAGIYPDVRMILVSGFESQKVDPSYFEYGKDTFLLAVDWSKRLIESSQL